ncbi:flagellar brake protein [Chitiniphilus eburneus]|nr:flagellar brake protein [Chitiniphilus eburneus]
MQHPSLTPIHLTNPQPYLVADPIHIEHLLNRLLRHGEIICLYPIGRREPFAIGALLFASDSELILDAPVDATVTELLLTHGACCVSQVRGVKHQFDCLPIQRIQYQGTVALSGPRPTQMLSMQRRQHFRMTLPLNPPVICEIPLAEDNHLQAIVSDLSAGGLKLSAHAPLPILVGQTLFDCRFTLPGFGQIETDLHIEDAQESELRSGAHQLHYGCQFIGLSRADQQKIQRYLAQLERRRLERDE